ncbi:hypothetical protein GCM10010335_17710 [Streptomyces galbus]|nr:hypothetical protein GCM10010335_17710 [Streptomyces galbus]
MHHGTDLVVVPDKGGDHGLEAYTLSGHLFQCYSPTEPLPTIIMCPYIDSKDLAAHCASQTKRVREACLDYADPDIHVICQTMKDYEFSYTGQPFRISYTHMPPLS